MSSANRPALERVTEHAGMVAVFGVSSCRQDANHAALSVVIIRLIGLGLLQPVRRDQGASISFSTINSPYLLRSS